MIRWLNYWLLLLASLVLCVTPTYAIPSIYHGRVVFVQDQHQGATINRVEGVAVLDLGGTGVIVNHFFQCNTSTGSVNNLRWERENGNLPRFPQTIIVNSQRLDMAPLDGTPVGYSDTGVYVCRDTVTGASASINITGGAYAICPDMPDYEIALGGSIDLRVFAAGNPPLNTNEIKWYGPGSNRREVVTGGRIQLRDSNRRLIIMNVELADGGTYRIEICRHIAGPLSPCVQAATTIELNVLVGPALVSSPSSVVVVEHNATILTCEFTGNPQPSITWEKEGGNLPPMTRRDIDFIPSPNATSILGRVIGRFSISSVLYEDRGRYRCVASNGNPVETVRSAYGELIVQPRLMLTAVEDNGVPHPINRIRLYFVTGGSRLEIWCNGSGSLFWNSSSQALIPVETVINPSINVYQRHDPTNNRQTLTIQNFTRTNTATYTCSTSLTSNGNPISESVFLTSSDPAVYILEDVKYITRGNTVSITASVYSSPQNTLVVEWYHNDVLIDAANNPRYSLSMSADGVMRTLNVLNADTDVLGEYAAVVRSQGRNETERIRLELPTPPTSTVIPTSRSVSEGEEVQFQCQVNGTEPSIVWTMEGSQPLPIGVQQVGNNLVIQSATRLHAGRYQCTVTNIAADVTTSFAMLTIFYIPTAVITYEDTSATSINQLLQVQLEHGDPAPRFSCAANGLPSPTVVWVGPFGNGAFPIGVTQADSITRQVLVWSRAAESSDSGRYRCIARNSQGNSTAIMDLLVRQRPSIKSISANPPVSTSSSSQFVVPLGHSGPVLTCTALAWPNPSIQWMRNGQRLTGRIVSESSITLNLAVARLRWTSGFLESDRGNYTCFVQADGMNSVNSTIILEAGTSTTATPSPPPVDCTVRSATVSFQIRVLDTDCLEWGDTLKQHIANTFSEDLMNIIRVECQNCSISAANLQIIDVPRCSQLIDRGAVFRGEITSNEISQTEKIFCALNRWQVRGPLVLINDQTHRVDQTCSLKSTGSECSSTNPNTVPLNIIIGASVGGGVGLIIFLGLVLLICCYCCYASRKKKESKDITTLSRRSEYERTTHTATDGASSRYKISPEDNNIPPRIGGTSDLGNPLYSTLDRTMMDSHPSPSFLPPPPPLMDPYSEDFQMDILRKNSRSRLLSGISTDGSPNNKSFIIQPDGSTPEPYQIAISSTENLNRTSQGSNGSPFLSGQVLNSYHSTSHAPNVGRTSSVSNQMNPVSSYEQIDRKYGVNEHSSFHSSPKLHMNDSGHVGGPGAHRVTSAGQMRGMPPMPFKRNMSAVEYRPKDTNEKYSLLSHTNQQGPPLPMMNQQRRVRSNSALPRPVLPQQSRQVSMEKRPSVTNYTRSSPSPTDSYEEENLTLKNPQVITPVAKEPPTSPYSPTSESSSMLENGAYEGLKIVQSEEPWYHNESDFSLNSISHQRDVAARPNITPYSQVSNLEIDYRRAEEMREKFSVSKTEPLPYAEPVKNSSTDNLSNIHSPSPPQFQTAVV